jgi:hypothetical protein
MLHAAERDSERVMQARAHYHETIAALPLGRLKFIDQSGINLAMTRRYGCADRGQRVPDTMPKNVGRNVTVLGALSCHGIEAVMTIDGATEAAVCRADAAPVLMPTLVAGDSVVIANLGRIKVTASGKPSRPPARLGFTCHPIDRIGRRPRMTGHNERRHCAPPKHAPVKRLISR